MLNGAGSAAGAGGGRRPWAEIKQPVNLRSSLPPPAQRYRCGIVFIIRFAAVSAPASDASAVHADASLTQVGERQMSNAAERGGRLRLFVARSALSLALQVLNGTPQSEINDCSKHDLTTAAGPHCLRTIALIFRRNVQKKLMTDSEHMTAEPNKLLFIP
ncbi:hypothetical protein EVAR_68439_1 [Eumeta japonica]|uniref:Uncharacterized protein n=1 Tax=Eumeta variegata TaxID=151549 RepID=A0A4C2A0H0_EUMVA|nr:hypothetical protein EVAR_68439_1 [Eumeta japonica]